MRRRTHDLPELGNGLRCASVPGKGLSRACDCRREYAGSPFRERPDPGGGLEDGRQVRAAVHRDQV